MADRARWEVHQEIIEPTPKCIREVCAAAGQDGWELTALLAVMLPPAVRRQERRLSSGLLLSERVNGDDRVSPALAAQLAEADAQPVPAVLLMFKRLAGVY